LNKYFKNYNPYKIIKKIIIRNESLKSSPNKIFKILQKMYFITIADKIKILQFLDTQLFFIKHFKKVNLYFNISQHLPTASKVG
jgi:hypothetical protein